MNRPALCEAAANGDMVAMNEVVAKHSAAGIDQYLLSQTTKTKDNIIHVAAENGQETFICEVMETLQLPPLLKVALLCQQNKDGANPLHIAASNGNLQIVQILIQSYQKVSKLDQVVDLDLEETAENPPPWAAATTCNRETPLIVAIVKEHEDVANYILSQDLELLCKMEDYMGRSPLYLAVEKGFERIALKILTFGCSYSIGPPTKYHDLLRNATKMTEGFGLLFVEKHPELLTARDTREETFLHNWVYGGNDIQPLQYLLKGKIFSIWCANYKKMLFHTNIYGNNPLHCAIFSGDVEFLKLLIDTYIQLIGPNIGDQPEDELPWLHQNYRGETPLHLAIERGQDSLVSYLLSFDSRSANVSTKFSESPLFLALRCGRKDIASEILFKAPRPLQYCGPNGQNPFHVASNCPGIAGILAECLPYDAFDDNINKKDEMGKAPLDYAAEVGDKDLMRLAFGHSGISSAPYAWIGACQGGHLDALRLFMENCDDFRELCLQQRDTPLHHMKLNGSKEEYQEFLKIPLFAQQKNVTDSYAATPLHRAIEQNNIVFAELLLGTEGINWTIKDNNGQTALDLLATKCDEFPDWDAICTRIGLNPRIKTSYIPLKTNMPEIRTTLSVVAALLATITFAAGFTTPGGFNSHGDVVLARNTAFIVFLLSDTYAMCCSMLVLFCLIWAMVCDPDESIVLVDRSIVILQQSLYGTLIAFMSGVYSVVSHNCLWTAVVVCVMCSLVAVATNKRVLYTLVNKIIPSNRICNVKLCGGRLIKLC